LYITIFFAGGFLLQSITEEKENRTIEIMLTSLAPWQLLGGKVLGLGLLGLAQMLIWLMTGRSLLGVATDRLAQPGLALPWSVWALAVVYFVFGYGVNAGIMAGIGATVAHVREGSQIVALLALPFVIPLWLLDTIADAPDGTLARTLSIFPLTAPVTMMIRVSLADVAPGEVALSVALLALCVALVIWLAARLFRVGTLLAGKRLSLGEIARAIRAA
jgi:ABC-2 type transport system permease protein